MTPAHVGLGVLQLLLRFLLLQATSRLLCWLRPSWHCTTMPVGMWVSRTAESVLLMCWPPAPDARKVSVRTSLGLMSISIESSISG